MTCDICQAAPGDCSCYDVPPKKTALEAQKRMRSKPKPKHPGKRAQEQKARAHQHARKRVERALQSGRMKKAGCCICGQRPAEFHHLDYSRPLFGVWLCKLHHDDETTGRKPRKLTGTDYGR